jgi:drug/metabolite transporter (DMT)-like permease
VTGRSAVAGGTAGAALRENRRGILFMVAAMACFVVNDTLVKLASETMPASQLIFLRGAMASVLVFALAQATGATVRIAEVARGWVAVRSLIDGLASLIYLVALFNMPIANATAINMASPLFITVLAVLLLGERVDARRWFAIALGFVGVTLVIQPRVEGFNAYALLCLFATFLHALRDLATRRIGPGVGSIAITLSTAVVVTLLAGVVSLAQGWRPFGRHELLLLAAAAVFLASGYYFIVRSTRAGEFSVIAPFRYSGLLAALLLGWVIWGDVPNAIAWAGIALLTTAGLYLVYRERMRVR